jgi:hypothetical protein
MVEVRMPDGFSLSPPTELEVEECFITLRAPDRDLAEPRSLNKQQPIRSNLVVRRRTVRRDASLDTLAGEMCGELAKSIPSLVGLERAGFKFDDGTIGLMLAYEFQASSSALLRQYHALRLDDRTLTTLTLTVDGRTLTDADRLRYFAHLATARPA